ncbi:MAG: hypothetical protein Q3979_05545 [Actinomycetaceae bacterium]|nr:hypothetical protein [Actinomycetaceae bacterium]
MSGLKAVASDGQKPKRRSKQGQKSVAVAAKSGDQKELLLALQDRIAVAVQDPATSPRDLAPLSRRLMEIAKELEAIKEQEREDGSIVVDVEDEPFDPSSV